MPRKTELPGAGDRGVRTRLPPPAGLSWCGTLLSAVVRGSTAPFLGSSSRGTEGSNPSPSTGESRAKLTSSIRVPCGRHGSAEAAAHVDALADPESRPAPCPGHLLFSVLFLWDHD